jgi:SAM-dependent methyltransferase
VSGGFVPAEYVARRSDRKVEEGFGLIQTRLEKEKTAGFYNRHRERAMLPLEDSPWRTLYKKAQGLLPASKRTPRIVDLGCGTGRFARLLSDSGYGDYLGIDFADELIEECKRYVPEYRFIVGDFFSPVVKSHFSSTDLFVVLEVLEHIASDLSLMETLPVGATVIGSVPNYDSEAHVRVFPSISGAVLRYGSLLDFDTIFALPLTHERNFFLFRGVRI